MERFSGERRQHRRYPIRLPATYKTKGFNGPAHTVDLSARGVRIESDAVLPVGTSVEVAVEWPVLFDGRTRLKLVYAGRVARAKSRTIALAGYRPEFRIAGRAVI
jgi:hypothetical protein